MGCSPSTLAVAELNKSLKPGDDCRALLGRLEDNPWLLSTATSVLVGTAGTPLHVACERKHVEAVQKIFFFLSCSPLSTVREALQPYCRRAGVPLPSSTAEGIKIAADMVNCKGQTPLMYSCAVGSPELVKLLLAQGADPWVRDRCGCRTALHYASMSGSAACVEALMAHLPARELERQGARYVDAKSLCGLTALHYAVFFEHLDTVEELLKHGPNVNAVTTCDSYDVHVTCDPFSTPLHFAAVRGNTQLARMLLQHHALHTPAWELQGNQDPRMRCNEGRQMPWQVAASHHPAARDLVSLLHPGQPLERALGLTGDGAGGWVHKVGPAPLALLAAAALRDKLLADLEGLAAAKAKTNNATATSLSAASGAHGGIEETGAVEQQRAAECGSQSVADGPANESQRLLQHALSLTASSSGVSEEGQCGLCFAGGVEVQPAGCGHAVCGRCAQALARGLVGAGRPRPLACPFCRREVGGFVAAPPPPETTQAAAAAFVAPPPPARTVAAALPPVARPGPLLPRRWMPPVEV